MKLVTVQYPDSIDINVLPKGTVVIVGDGTHNLPNGTVVSLADVQDPEPAIHTHIVSPPV